MAESELIIHLDGTDAPNDVLDASAQAITPLYDLLAPGKRRLAHSELSYMRFRSITAASEGIVRLKRT